MIYNTKDNDESHMEDYYKTDWSPVWCIIGIGIFFLIIIYIFA
jgi:hypothetical protein